MNGVVAEPAAARVRVVTWNVWGGGPDGARREAALVRELRSVTPDVITLQKAPRSPGGDQATNVAEQLGLGHVQWWPYRTVPADPPEAQVGLAVLSRWPLSRPTVRALSTPAARRQGGRLVAGAVVEHPSGPFGVVTTHLNSDPAASAERCQEVRQVAELASELEAVAGVSGLVVTGDLNAEPDADEVRRLGGLLTAPAVPGLTLADAWRYALEPPVGSGATWLADNGHLPWGTTDGRIDYVMTGHGLVPVRVGRLGVAGARIDEGESVWASTHCGLWADIVARAR